MTISKQPRPSLNDTDSTDDTQGSAWRLSKDHQDSGRQLAVRGRPVRSEMAMNEALDVGNWADDSDYRRKRDWWWATLRTLRQEWMATRTGDFDTWLLDTHGVRIVYTNNLIIGEYEIADEKKHLVFLLRYI